MFFLLVLFAYAHASSSPSGLYALRHASDASLETDAGVFVRDARLLFSDEPPTGTYALTREAATCGGAPVPGRTTPYRLRVQQAAGTLSVPISSLATRDGRTLARGLAWYTCATNGTTWTASPCSASWTPMALVQTVCQTGIWALTATSCSDAVDCTTCLDNTKGCYCEPGPVTSDDWVLAAVIVLLFWLPRLSWTWLVAPDSSSKGKWAWTWAGLETLGYVLSFSQSADMHAVRWTSPNTGAQTASIVLSILAMVVAFAGLLTNRFGTGLVEVLAMGLFDAAIVANVEAMVPTASVRAWSNAVIWVGWLLNVAAYLPVLARARKAWPRATLSTVTVSILLNAAYLIPFVIPDCEGRSVQ